MSNYKCTCCRSLSIKVEYIVLQKVQNVRSYFCHKQCLSFWESYSSLNCVPKLIFYINIKAKTTYIFVVWEVRRIFLCQSVDKTITIIIQSFRVSKFKKLINNNNILNVIITIYLTKLSFLNIKTLEYQIKT